MRRNICTRQTTYSRSPTFFPSCLSLKASSLTEGAWRSAREFVKGRGEVELLRDVCYAALPFLYRAVEQVTMAQKGYALLCTEDEGRRRECEAARIQFDSSGCRERTGRYWLAGPPLGMFWPSTKAMLD
ncbi:hypothetical protein HNY73_000138 [Argiope bruennichi]|uniref:Uncharacterized protein n=1 Tax=Argiope bruennichi TaxID=94029 RepID=A0A8T0FY91_ARGBR|nr:hypothetical protein HNY73_000138 [Argiope bruennichi]